MTIKEILSQTDHRPWPLPQEPWRFYQEWNQVLFLHWQVELEELQKFVPAGIEIDLFEGKPWVSLVPFTMENIRPRYLPPFNPLSYFHEVNLRTYIKHTDGRTGVYFLSIEGSKLLACKLSKAISELPYRYSKMERTPTSYISNNNVYGDRLSIDFSLGDSITQKTELDKWLTERYALFQNNEKGRVNAFEIHHAEWDMQQLHIYKLELSYPRFEKLIGRLPDLVHYSPGIQVVAYGKHTF